jgi:ABC-type transport system substrate-binding protein
MCRRVLTLLLVAGMVAFATPAALASNGTSSGGGSITATISIAGNAAQPLSVSNAVAFSVNRTVVDNTVYWVYNYCWDGSGTLLSTEAYPVLWPSWNSLTGGTYPYVFRLSGTHCEALVTIKPWTAQPLKGAVLYYRVG